ncbi:MAG: hypothetical protein HDS14_06000 [Bacteroides sp.]|nr:hypothetical protein [Bacteroides sp.]
MATTHNISRSIYLSYRLPDLSVSTDLEALFIRISRDGYTITHNLLYASGHKISIYALRSLIETDMADNDLSVASYTLLIENADSTVTLADKSFSVIFCARDVGALDESSWLARNFLIADPFRRIPSSATIRLPWIPAQGETPLLSIAIHADAPGSSDLSPVHLPVLRSESPVLPDAPAPDISFISIPLLSVPEEYGLPSGAIIRRIDILLGERGASFFIDPDLDQAPAFIYRDSFNIQTSVNIPAVTASKTETDRQLCALIDRNTITAHRTWKLFSSIFAPLPDSEISAVEDLVASHMTAILIPASDPEEPLRQIPIAITEINIDRQDPDDLTEVSFSYRLADDLDRAVCNSSSVFTYHFNPVFN